MNVAFNVNFSCDKSAPRGNTVCREHETRETLPAWVVHKSL